MASRDPQVAWPVMNERPAPEFTLRWKQWLLIFVVALLVVLGGTAMWISAAVGVGVALGLLALRPYSTRTRIGLVLGALVLAGVPVVWVITQLATR